MSKELQKRLIAEGIANDIAKRNTELQEQDRMHEYDFRAADRAANLVREAYEEGWVAWLRRLGGAR